VVVKVEALYKKIAKNFIFSEKLNFFNFLFEDKQAKEPKIDIYWSESLPKRNLEIS
jgi:hypothetical protein